MIDNHSLIYTKRILFIISEIKTRKQIVKKWKTLIIIIIIIIL